MMFAVTAWRLPCSYLGSRTILVFVCFGKEIVSLIPRRQQSKTVMLLNLERLVLNIFLVNSLEVFFLQLYITFSLL